MTGMTEKIQARIDPALKQAAEAVFSELGLTATDAIRLFYSQVRLHSGLPFEVKIPNAKTQAAMRQAVSDKTGKPYKTTQAMLVAFNVAD